MEVRDKIGQEIVAGKFIVYGHALGRCAGLRIGKVVQVFEPEKTNNKYSPYTYKIKVRGMNDDWSFHEATLLSRDSYLWFPDRMIVLDETKLPDIVRKLYKNI